MRYRPEIDGLRAVAVVSVALFHAGLEPFGGGFVGVDVFFVISGYLITATIVEGLDAHSFSLASFYERRTRRLLPALFVVMAACSPLADRWMLPNDLSNFGQSLVATSLFLNNALLLHTSGYWSLPAEFKPLLHTWSLGIEEQYYILFPLLMLAGWRLYRLRIVACLVVIAGLSLTAAQWMSGVDRAADFYLAPTRAWEFLAGSLVAFRLRRRLPVEPEDLTGHQVMSAAGLALLAFSVGCFGRTTPTPSVYTLVPVCGTALVLMFATEGTVAFRLLAHRVPVGIGLISYSLYLWHLPMIAFARIACVGPPSPGLIGVLLALTVPIAYLSWRFVERPFRSGDIVGRTAIVSGSVLMSAAFVAYGTYLHLTRGLPGRLYPQGVAADDLYIAYNDRVFRLKRDAFARPEALHVLVVGNSFARDFVNMTAETFDMNGVEIVYRDDLGACLASWAGSPAGPLLDRAAVIVFASRYHDYRCVGANIERADALGKRLFYAGGKHFGANMNWLMRLRPEERGEQLNPLLPDMIRKEAEDTAAIPPAHFISILAPIVRGGRIPITDERGWLLGTPDRTHLTLYGARYVGARVLLDSPFGDALRSSRCTDADRGLAGFARQARPSDGSGCRRDPR